MSRYDDERRIALRRIWVDKVASRIDYGQLKNTFFCFYCGARRTSRWEHRHGHPERLCQSCYGRTLDTPFMREKNVKKGGFIDMDKYKGVVPPVAPQENSEFYYFCCKGNNGQFNIR